MSIIPFNDAPSLIAKNNMNIEVFLQEYCDYLLEPKFAKLLAIYSLYFGP